MASKKLLKVTIVALAVATALTLAVVVYSVAEIHRLRTGGVDLSIYTIDEIVELPTELTGEELLRSIGYRGMKHAMIGDYLYYANPDRNLHMYRFNLETYSHALYLQVPVFGVITDGERLFIMAGTSPDAGIFSVDPIDGCIQAIAYGVDIDREFHKYRGVIFYSDIYGQARAILPCGRPFIP